MGGAFHLRHRGAWVSNLNSAVYKRHGLFIVIVHTLNKLFSLFQLLISLIFGLNNYNRYGIWSVPSRHFNLSSSTCVLMFKRDDCAEKTFVSVFSAHRPFMKRIFIIRRHRSYLWYDLHDIAYFQLQLVFMLRRVAERRFTSPLTDLLYCTHTHTHGEQEHTHTYFRLTYDIIGSLTNP